MERKLISAAIVIALGTAYGLPASAETPYPQSKSSTEAATSTTGNAVLTRRADELDGMDVVNSQGDEIGEVEAIVRGKTRNDLQAVVSVGGFLGIGDKKVAIPLQEMQLTDGKLRAPMASTEDELKARIAYDDTMFTKISDEQLVQIGSGSARTVDGSAMPSRMNSTAQKSMSRNTNSDFSSLDMNQDGYVSKEEAAGNPGLANTWNKADSNGDGQLDQSEFSAFELTTEHESSGKSAPDLDRMKGGDTMPHDKDGSMR